MNKALVILSELNDRDIDWMVSNGKREQVSVDTVLIYEGQPTSALYIVLEGTLSVSVAAVGNQEIGRIGCGEVLGEMSFIDGRLPSATVKAVEDSVVLTIPRQKLAEKLDHDVLFALRFYRAVTKFLSSRLRNTVNRFGEEGKTNTNSASPGQSSDHHLEPSQSRFELIMKRLRGVDFPD
ncbi:MAG: cyclic nucleotide-binding domain-containing protein [Cyanobacteria bacterium J06592_8]